MTNRRVIELDLDDVTVVEDPLEVTPMRGIAVCGCGKIQERGGPMSLAGLAIQDWPCCSGKRWRYCATVGQIVMDVR